MNSFLRIKILQLFVVAMFIILAIRLFYIQVIDSW